MSDNRAKPLTTCCERDCSKPVDRPRSRVRCADHYTPPRFGGHAPFGRSPRTNNREEPHE